MLKDVQGWMVKDPFNNQLQSEVYSLRESHTRFLAFGESFLKEKSRVKWMKEEEKNTRLFHRAVKTHCVRNKNPRL